MKDKSFGFTLVELLVTMVIGLLVLGFGAVFLNNFYDRQKVVSVGQELLSELMLARNYAVTNQFPSGSSSDTDRVAVMINNDGLLVIGTQTTGSVGNDTNVKYTFFSKDIVPKGVGVTFRGPDGVGVIRFSITDGRLIGGTASVVINGVGTTKNIKIDESGLIYEK